MCAIDLEPCEVWKETTRRARKPHICSCCDVTIHPGVEYVVHFSVFDGEATTEKICAKCQAIAIEFQDDHGQRSVPSYMPQLLADCIGEGDDGSKKWKRHLGDINRRSANARRARAA